MKKSSVMLFLIILALVVGLCGCGESEVAVETGEGHITKESTKMSETEEKQNTEESDERSVAGDSQNTKEESRLCTKETYFDGDTNSPIRYWLEYEYDELGNQVKATQYNADGTVDSWYVFDYDEQGNQIKATEYDSNGSEKSWTEYTYNALGQEIENLNYYMNHGTAKLEYRSTKEYDADGNMTIWKFIWGDYIREEVHEYDSSGNEIKVSTSDTNDPDPYWTEYEYDDKGDTRRGTRYNAEGVVDGWREYEYRYDGAGCKTGYSITYFKQDGSVMEILDVDYTEFGEYAKYTDYEADGTASRTILYEYK